MQGVTPSAKMLSAPVRHPPIPFVSARARVAEFERLREEIRKTEMVRERQVEMLHVLANEASCELDGPQVCQLVCIFSTRCLILEVW